MGCIRMQVAGTRMEVIFTVIMHLIMHKVVVSIGRPL